MGPDEVLADPDRPGDELDLKLLIADYGHRWEVYPPGPGARCWLAYDRERPMFPAVTAENADEMRDRLALLTRHPRP